MSTKRKTIIALMIVFILMRIKRKTIPRLSKILLVTLELRTFA